MSTSKEIKTKVKKQKYFMDDWLQDEAFSNWLVKDKNGNTKGRCSVIKLLSSLLVVVQPLLIMLKE